MIHAVTRSDVPLTVPGQALLDALVQEARDLQAVAA